MKRAALFLALTMAVLLPQAASAQDTNKDINDKSDKAREAAFDKRVFGGPIRDKAGHDGGWWTARSQKSAGNGGSCEGSEPVRTALSPQHFLIPRATRRCWLTIPPPPRKLVPNRAGRPNSQAETGIMNPVKAL